MSQQNPLELAKQGNPTAIAALINHGLKPKGITAKVSRKDDRLNIMLESKEFSNQDSLIKFIYSGILKLEISEINTLQVFGRQPDDEVPAWSQFMDLRRQQLYPISQKQTPDNNLEPPIEKGYTIPHDTSSKSTLQADSGKSIYSSKTSSSKQSQVSLRSEKTPKKTDNLVSFSLVNSSPESDLIFQWIGILFFLSLLALIIWGVIGDGSDPSPIIQTPSNITTTPPDIVASQNKMTMGQQQAVAKGENYLDIVGFSRQGLIDQLVYEGFSETDATFAVDQIAPDWNEQAAKKAQNYINTLSFSRQGLIDQLIYEGFTEAQAEYGAKAVGY